MIQVRDCGSPTETRGIAVRGRGETGSEAVLKVEPLERSVVLEKS